MLAIQDEQIDSVYKHVTYDTKQYRQVLADQQADVVVIHQEKMRNLGKMQRPAR